MIKTEMLIIHIEEMERSYIAEVLAHCGGKIAWQGWSRGNLRHETHNLDLPHGETRYAQNTYRIPNEMKLEIK